MIAYRRRYISGGSFFFTVNLANRSSRLLTESVDLLRTAVRKIKQAHASRIDAWVVLPEHLHAIWTLPFGERDDSTRWRIIKGNFA